MWLTLFSHIFALHLDLTTSSWYLRSQQFATRTSRIWLWNDIQLSICYATSAACNNMWSYMIFFRWMVFFSGQKQCTHNNTKKIMLITFNHILKHYCSKLYNSVQIRFDTYLSDSSKSNFSNVSNPQPCNIRWPIHARVGVCDLLLCIEMAFGDSQCPEERNIVTS